MYLFIIAAIFSGETKTVKVPSYEGDMSLLKDHVSIISFLRPGIVKVEKKDGSFEGELMPVRKAGEIGLAKPENIEMMDVSPKQLVSVAAALIPFL